MKKKKIIAVFVSLLMLSSTVSANNDLSLPKELADKYPYRESQTTVKYAPWFTLVNRASAQNLQIGMNAGENCQVTTALAFSDANPDHIIAGFDTNGIAISTDDGENWYYSQTKLGTHSCFTALWHPTDENIVYKVSSAYNGSRYRTSLIEKAENRGLFRSKDCGKTWEKILDYSMPMDYGAKSLTFDSKGNLYALTNYGVFKSGDDGDTWTQILYQENWNVYDIVVSDDCKTLLIAAVNGLSASFDGGETWEFRNGKQFYGTATSVDIDPLDSKHWVAAFTAPYKCFAESYDLGKTWSLIDTNLSLPERIKFGGVMENGKRYMYAVGSSGDMAYRVSKDGGVTWQYPFVDTKNGKANTCTQREGLALSKKHPEIVWYAFGDGINVSYDGGIRFYNRSAGHGGQKCFKKIVTDDEGRIHFPGTDTGYFHTSAPYKSGEPFPACIEPYRMWGSAIAISPHNPKFMLLGGGEQGERVLYRSYDKGETWQRIVGSDAAKNYKLIEFHEKDKNVIYTSNKTSFDGGRTWEENTKYIDAVSPVDNDILYNITASESSNGELLISISYDKGKTWQECLSIYDDIGTFFLYPDKFEKDEIWTQESGGAVLKKYKGNEEIYSYDFTKLYGNNINSWCFAQDPMDREHLLVAISCPTMDIGIGLVESFDGGKTWTAISGNPGNGMIEMICFEEKTNDIFINGFCGLVIYDSKAYREYCEKSAQK